MTSGQEGVREYDVFLLNFLISIRMYQIFEEFPLKILLYPDHE